MNIFSGFIAMRKAQALKRGRSVYLSKAEIATLVFNMSDARKNLPQEDFYAIYHAFSVVSRDKSKVLVRDIDDYFKIAADLIFYFDKIAPFEKYSGMSEAESYALLADVLREKGEI